MRGCPATPATRLGDFPFQGVVRIAAGTMRGRQRGNGFKMIPLRSSFLRRLIAAALVVPSLWNVALSWQPSAATVVALDPGVTAGVLLPKHPAGGRSCSKGRGIMSSSRFPSPRMP
jgi:hypothetical protein